MLPVLRSLEDGELHVRQKVLATVTDFFNLSEAERKEMLPSGKAPVIRSRISWAITYLKQAGLLHSPKRGVYRLTDRGRTVLSGGPDRVDIHTLEQFQEFVDFRSRSRTTATDKTAPSIVGTGGSTDDVTPEEALENAFQELRGRVEAELLEVVKSASPDFFERLVVELLVAIGYGGSRKDAGQAIGRSGDEGIDGIIKEDRLGLDLIYLQAKRWENAVGRPEIQKFAGALQGHRARKGVFITTSEFTREAVEYASRIDSKIVLIDGKTLAQLMFDHNVGVTRGTSYEAKQINSDYFAEE